MLIAKKLLSRVGITERDTEINASEYPIPWATNRSSDWGNPESAVSVHTFGGTIIAGRPNNAWSILEIETMVDRLVEEKIESYFRARELKLKLRIISDQQAEEEISTFFEKNLADGVTTVNVLDIVNALNIPGSQVEEVLDLFEKKKKINRYEP